MEGQILEKAVEDIQLIRNVMVRSSHSVTALNKIFILWGTVFFTVGALSWSLIFIWPDLFDILTQVSPFLIVLPKVMITLAALIIYIVFREGVCNEGLNRQFLLIWLAIIGYNNLWPSFIHLVLNRSHFISFVPGFTLISFAVGMLCMRIFTRMSLPGWMALSCVVLDIILSILSNILKDNVIFSYSKSMIFGLIMPLSLLVFGFFLKKKREKLWRVS